MLGRGTACSSPAASPIPLTIPVTAPALAVGPRTRNFGGSAHAGSAGAVRRAHERPAGPGIGRSGGRRPEDRGGEKADGRAEETEPRGCPPLVPAAHDARTSDYPCRGGAP